MISNDQLTSDLVDEIRDLHRYLFPELHDDIVAGDHPFFTPGEDECFEWRSETIEVIADGIQNLYNMVSEITAPDPGRKG